MIKKISNKLKQYRNRRTAKKNFIHTDARISGSAKIELLEIHGNVSIADHTMIHQSLLSGDISIGKNTTLWGPNINILSKKESITIGNFCSIASATTMKLLNSTKIMKSIYSSH